MLSRLLGAILPIDNKIVRGIFADRRKPLPRFDWFFWINYLAINYLDRFRRQNEGYDKKFT